MAQHHKVIIVGSGPAGLTAAIYTSRAALEPFLIEGEPVGTGDQPGGQLMNTTEIENFPGVIGLQGPELMARMREQAASFGTKIITERVTRVDLSNRPFGVWVGETEYRADSLIVTTGAAPLMPGLPNEWDLMGRGISACATCDGFFFKDKDIAVMGGGDSAMEEATFLTKFAKSVTIIHRRDTLRASQVMQSRAKADPKIKFLWNAQISELKGTEKFEGVTVTDTVTGKTSELPLDGLFIAIGHRPNSELFVDQLELTEEGYIKTNGVMTSVEGVFAAGDVQDARYRQAITSAGSGCMAALEAQHFLEARDEAAPTVPMAEAKGAPATI